MNSDDWRGILTKRDEEVLRGCLEAAVDGPFFPDWEFHTLFGLRRDKVSSVLATWPEADDPEAQLTAVLNAIANLLGYPHGFGELWPEFIPGSPEEVESLGARIRATVREDPTE